MPRATTGLALATVCAVGFAGDSSLQEGGSYSDRQVLWGSPLTNTTGRAAGLAAFNVSEEGAIEAIVDGQTAVIKSTFSSLGQQSSFGGGVGAGNWSQPVQIDRPRDGVVRVRGAGTVFSIERWITSASGRVEINDTVRVLQAPPSGSQAIAVEVSHSASFVTPGLVIASVDGPNNEYRTECTSESVGMYLLRTQLDALSLYLSLPLSLSLYIYISLRLCVCVSTHSYCTEQVW